LRERVMQMVQEPETTAGSRGDGPVEVTAEELAGLRFFEGMPGWALEAWRNLGKACILGT
jgi:hypothetical protein